MNSSTLSRPLPARTSVTHRPPLEFAARPGEQPIDTARRLSATLAPVRRFVPTTPIPSAPPLAILGPGGDFTRTIDASPSIPDAGAVAAASVNAAACDAVDACALCGVPMVLIPESVLSGAQRARLAAAGHVRQCDACVSKHEGRD